MLWVPSRLAKEYAQHCVVKPKSFDGTPVDAIDPVVSEGAFTGLPLTIGVEWLRKDGHEIVDNTTEGSRTLTAKCLPSPTHKSAPPGQEAFFAEVLERTRSQLAACAQAQTGSGKTVCACYVAGTLGRATLAIVPSVTLAHQWIQEARKHLGLKAGQVGIVQAGYFPADKEFVVAVIHNLITGDIPSGWAEQFGFVIWDEAHRLGAREFSKSLPLFPAKYKLALTATPNRKDGCWRLVEDYFGPVSALAEGDEMETHCYAIYSDFTAPKWLADKNQLAPFIPFLTDCPGRNKIITDTAIDLHRRGRRLVIMSDSVRHLQILHKMLVSAGIDKADFGFYTGFTIHPDDFKRRVKKPRKRLVTAAAHQAIKDSSRIKIVLGTYAQMREGVNIPWLDAGIDATPRADAIQTIGRIRRRMASKPVPCWFTIIDRRIPLLNAFANSRIRGFVSVGVTVHTD